MPKAKFHGILAVGRTKTDAVNKYRLLAMGKGAVAQVDSERKFSFVTHASHADHMFNPHTGDMDLESDSALLKSLEFASTSSADVEVNHLVCTSGCKAHIVFDSATLVKYCPQCTAALSSDDSEDDSDEEESEDADEEEESDDTSDDSGDADSGEEESEGDADSGEEESEDDSDTPVVISSSFAEAMRVYSESSDMSSLSSGEQREVHYVVCSSDKCGAHIVSGKVVDECPACLSSVEEPDSDEVEGELELGGEESDEDELDMGEDSDEEDAGDESESSDEDSDEEDAGDEEPDDDLEDSEESDDDEGDDEVAVSSSFKEALKKYSESSDMSSLSSSEKRSVHYVVCSSAECGSHIVSGKVLSECPKCHSSVEEPDEESLDTEVDLGESESDDESSEENALSVTDESDDSGESDESEGDELNEDTEEIAADSDVDETAEASDLDVSYSSAIKGQPVWTAFFKGVPIAMASKSSAGKNADIFDSPAFGQAALATAKVAGVKKALGELGFAPIKHKVSVSKEVRRLVDTQVAEQRAALASELGKFKEGFQAALATAAIGINRGFFADVKNPLKMALWNALSSAGIRNPEVLIDTAFKNHSDAYHTVLFAQASDIATKPEDVRESLAKTILGTNYQAVSSEATGESAEDRLAALGTSVSTEQKPGVEGKLASQSSAADPGMQQIHRAVSSLGRYGR